MADLSSEASQRPLRILEFFGKKARVADGWLSGQWLDAVRADPNLSRAVVTADIVFGRDTLVRVSTQTVVVTSTLTGEEIAYLPQLMEEPDLSRSCEVGKQEAEVESVSFQVASQLVNPSRIIQAGRMIAGYAEICLQVPGGVYEERLVLLRGEMTGGVSFGADDEVLSVEVSDPKITADLIVPPWVASAERHADIPEDWTGERYPIVFNGYQKIEAIRLDTSTGWPTGVFPDWLACYGHGGTVGAVYVNGVAKASGSTDYPWAEVDALDLQGTPYKEVSFSSSSTTWEDNDSVHVSVTADESLHLVEILQKLVEEYSVLGVRGSHQPLFARARGRLPDLRPSVKIDASNAADEGGILTFLEGTLLESYPMVAMVWQNGRYGPVVLDYRSGPVAADLVAGEYPLVDRSSDYQEIPKEDILNSFVVRYAWDPLAETFGGVVTRDPSNDPTCYLSREDAGSRAADALESLFIQTAAEAGFVIDWLVAHLAVPSYYVEWEVKPWVQLFLVRGDRVWYTDEERGWEAERALVLTIGRVGGKIVMGLRVWPGQKRLHTLRDG